MALKVSLVLVLIVMCSCAVDAISGNNNQNCLNKNGSSLAAIKMPDHPNINTVSSSADSDCSFSNSEKFEHSGVTTSDEDADDSYVAKRLKQLLKLNLKRRPVMVNEDAEPRKSMIDFTVRDLTRIQTLHRRVIEKKNQNTVSRLQKIQPKSKHQLYEQVVTPAPAPAPAPAYFANEHPGRLVATLESGASFGSGEYFMDVFVGTPPKHFSLILDTGSDLNWIQCVPCYVCFEQSGPHYDPKDSSSFKNISCHDQRCQLVSSPDPPQACKAENQTCPYFYWYGDSSNTTGDFALETFTVNLTASSGKSEFRRVEDVMFGCGHWNRGLFHGAAGLLGLGRGPLSFASQLQSLYGHSFSYCLVDRNSNISSKLIFGEDKKLLRNPNLNFTSFVGGKENPVDTFYYVQIKSVIVGGEVLNIPKETWLASAGGGGGTIIDSGTTLTYFAEPAYEIIKEAFMKKIKGYLMIEDGHLPLKPCYNVSGFEAIELPNFGIMFADGAVWDFPAENYFIEIEPGSVVCLAILGTPHSALSIIGNYQQQNFHILYDLKNSRLGYAPVNCADS